MGFACLGFGEFELGLNASEKNQAKHSETSNQLQHEPLGMFRNEVARNDQIAGLGNVRSSLAEMRLEFHVLLFQIYFVRITVRVGNKIVDKPLIMCRLQNTLKGFGFEWLTQNQTLELSDWRTPARYFM